MDIESFRNYCLNKPGTSEEFPFDNQALVFKVLGKMYALCNVDLFERINLKCDPEYAVELREKYDGLVIPGYHMNKKHWNTIIINEGIPDKTIFHWVNHSYDLVVSKLPKKDREALKNIQS